MMKKCEFAYFFYNCKHFKLFSLEQYVFKKSTVNSLLDIV